MLLAGVVILRGENPVSVCGVLSDLGRYRGKLIAIHGFLGGGSRHGWYLQDDAGDDKPCVAVVQAGQTWPPDIALIQYVRGSEIEDRPPSFESDARQIENMLSEPQRVVSDRGDLVIAVTLVGELRSRKDIRILRSKEGWWAGNGYGQSGQYPAVLVLKTVADARVVRKSR
jgi:hypothetical protein